MIYFIQAGEDGPIKIGFSDNPQVRLGHLQTASPYPLRILATIDGSQAFEGLLHRHFSALRSAGEWFRPDPQLLDFIASPGAYPALSDPMPFPTPDRPLPVHQPTTKAAPDGVLIPWGVVKDPSIGPAALAVYMATKHLVQAEPRGHCTATARDIGKVIGLGERQVRTHINSLIAAGHLIPYRGGPNGRSDRTLVVSLMETDQDIEDHA